MWSRKARVSVVMAIPSARLPAVGFLVKFGVGELSENRENPNSIKTGQEYRTICAKNKCVLLLQATEVP